MYEHFYLIGELGFKPNIQVEVLYTHCTGCFFQSETNRIVLVLDRAQRQGLCFHFERNILYVRLTVICQLIIINHICSTRIYDVL